MNYSNQIILINQRSKTQTRRMIVKQQTKQRRAGVRGRGGRWWGGRWHTWAGEMSAPQRGGSVLSTANRRGKHLGDKQNQHHLWELWEQKSAAEHKGKASLQNIWRQKPHLGILQSSQAFWERAGVCRRQTVNNDHDWAPLFPFYFYFSVNFYSKLLQPLSYFISSNIKTFGSFRRYLLWVLINVAFIILYVLL